MIFGGKGGGGALVNMSELALAVQNDKELKNLLSYLTVAQGGMFSNIHKVLLPQKKEKTDRYWNSFTTKMELSVALCNGCKLLTFVTNSSIFTVARLLDLLLKKNKRF